MAETSIQWADFTFNHVSGCTKVSPGCKNCYAEVNYSVKMRGVKWGPQGNRIVKAESGWKEPLKWDREAGKAFDDWQRSGDHEGPSTIPPARPRVFCASLADIFEDWQWSMLDSKGEQLWKQWEDARGWDASPIRPSPRSSPLTMQDVRDRLFRLIDATPNLDWLVLTKRPENIERMMPAYFQGSYIAEAGAMNQEGPRPNLWLGTSCENQQTADERIPHLLRVPAAVRFLSCEPLLGPIDLSLIKTAKDTTADVLRGIYTVEYPPEVDGPGGIQECDGGPKIDWVIAGGESGHGARPCDLDWIRAIVQQCKEANVPVFVKQAGALPVYGNPSVSARECYPTIWGPVKDPKGGNMEEWPLDLRVREFPA